MRQYNRKLLMTSLMVLGLMGFGPTQHGWAGERQEARIEELERDNTRLLYECNRLQAQVRELQRQAANRRQYGTYSPSYSYGNGGLNEINRQLRELEQTRRTLESLKR